ncbi:MAG: DUF86 domain-containing protein [Kineosporiaceae bacterium]
MSPKRLDDETVEAKIALIRERLDLLEGLGAIDAARLESDLATRLVVERALTHVVELAAAVNSHVAATTLGRSPRDYRQSFALAAESGLVDHELGRALAPSAGLRNVVVHEYLAIDFEILAAAVPRALEGYRAYVTAVARWLLARRDRD